MSESETKTILVVDDEKDVRQYLSMALTDAGFRVVTACDGFEALEKVKDETPDLISLDLVMPKRSGIKFYRDLITNKRWSRIPILVVTGHARDELGKADLKELTISGPGIYLEKPVKPQNYIASIKKLLNMETSDDEKTMAEQTVIQNEIKDMIDEADMETLEKLKKLMKKYKS